MSDPKSNDVLTTFEDAAFQRQYLRMRQNDVALKTDQESGEQFYLTLHYAVDSNVFGLLCDPAVDAEEKKGRIGVGAIFRLDDSERQKAIAASIATYLFYQLSANRPLIAIVPIEREIRDSINHFSKILALSTKGSGDRLSALLKTAKGLNYQLDEDQLVEIKKALLFDSSAAAAVRRIGEVLRAGRIASSEVLVRSEDTEAVLRDALMPAVGDEVSSFGEISKVWSACLKRVEAERRDGELQPKEDEAHESEDDPDVEAMTRLTLACLRLDAWTKGRHRLVYLTMDSRLLKAGDYFFDAFGDFTGFEAFKRLRRLGGLEEVHERTFTDMFLRHPRCYLDEEGVLRPPVVGDGSNEPKENEVAAKRVRVTLIGWLDVLLGKLRDEGGGPLLQSEADAARVRDLEDRRNIFSDKVASSIESQQRYGALTHQDLLHRWADYQVAQSRDFSESLQKRLESSLAEGYVPFCESLERLREEIEKELATTWNDLLIINVEARLLLQSNIDNQRSRHVPMLFFEHCPEFSEVIACAKRWQRSPSTSDLIEYRTLKEKLLNHDPSGYAYYLANSYLFALDGQWASAAILATRAREVSAAFATNSPRGPNGREATYFEAHCLRRAGATLPQLDDLRASVLRAKQILKMESDGSAGSRHEVVAERFDAELLAIRFTKILMQWGREADLNRKNAKIAQAADLVPEYWDLYRSTALRFESFPEPGTDPECADLLLQVMGRTLINLIAIGIQVESVRESARQAWAELHRLKVDGFSSFFASVVYLCAECMFGNDDRASTARGALAQKFKNGEFKRYKLFVYDRARFDDMLAKCDVELTSAVNEKDDARVAR